MQFIVTGYDGKDDDALGRRMVARDAHLKVAKEMADNGKWLYAAAIINEKEQMAGSVIICEFDSKESLKKEWLDNEPYILGKVWEKVEIMQAQIPKLFL
jgi:uncharacterized protein